MKQNIGNTERLIRAIAGAVFIGVGFYFQSWWGALGLVPLATAALGWCPPYAMLGISTCKANPRTP